MSHINKLSFILLFAGILCLSFGGAVFAQSAPQIQTSPATNIQGNSAALNAEITYLGSFASATVYFQWGTSSSYGSQSSAMSQNFVGDINQIINGLASNATYHYRAVAQNSYGTVYGQDMTFITGQSNNTVSTANAGPDLYLTSGQTATLQGSGYDSNGFALSYSWSCNGGTLSNYNMAQPVYTAPNISTQATYTCTLTVTNSNGNSNADSSIVYLNYNSNPGSVQTTYATYISNFQVTLNGKISNPNSSVSNYAYFQWGTTTSYGTETPQQFLGYSGTFMQNITSLNSGTAYHYRAVAHNNNGTVYGQDMTFTTSGPASGNSGNYNNSALSSAKMAINLTSGNLNWSASVSASPSDILSFAITLRANSQDVHNVIIRDVLPAGLIYKGNLTINNSNYGGDITSGVNIGTIHAGQTATAIYQVQVAPAVNFSFGTTTLNNSVSITSSEAGTQNSSASVAVNKTLVYGATTVSTGLTNYLLTDSFLLPLLLVILGLWFYFSGEVYVFTNWIKKRI